MPRYFFHIRGARNYSDPTGLELEGDGAAHEHAKAYAKTISRFHNNPLLEIQVTDSAGAEICRVPSRTES